ncbi:hypothetical protein DOTSEDRAFT_27455 [Dothistroma septosporum NZE10]|uniref:Uncharacterized protein n=1 Tax=Dothistroma septosporum (strain NZE10 / CBS 128990) TaxID=675120 RepID=N1PER2_DOTSN|nr:hypothetical protein DOTSEDRAFT_27455 [Dothistroma septosporum NZE10]
MHTDALRKGLHSLPQELYDQILATILTVPPTLHTITPSWRPPIQLQISRDIRYHYGHSYFSSSTFLFPSYVVLAKWLHSLDPQHKEKVKDIRIRVLKEWSLCSEDASMRQIQNQQVCLRVEREMEELEGNFGLPSDGTGRLKTLMGRIVLVEEGDVEGLRDGSRRRGRESE